MTATTNHDVSDVEPTERDDDMNLAQKAVFVIAGAWTVLAVLTNLGQMFEWHGEVFERLNAFSARYQWWILAGLGVLAVLTWAAGRFERRDVRVERAESRELARRRRAERRAVMAARREAVADRRRELVSELRSTRVEALAGARVGLQAIAEHGRAYGEWVESQRRGVESIEERRVQPEAPGDSDATSARELPGS